MYDAGFMRGGASSSVFDFDFYSDDEEENAPMQHSLDASPARKSPSGKTAETGSLYEALQPQAEPLSTLAAVPVRSTGLSLRQAAELNPKPDSLALQPLLCAPPPAPPPPLAPYAPNSAALPPPLAAGSYAADELAEQEAAPRMSRLTRLDSEINMSTRGLACTCAGLA